MNASRPTLLATILLLLTGTPALGQVSLVVTGGVNIASLDISTDDDFFVPDFKSVTRLSIGLAANIPASDGWGLQLGGSYSQKGGRFEFSEQGVSAESRVETDYLEFTVLGRARFPVSGDRVSAHLLAGPALALESSCQLTAKATDPDDGTFEFAEDCDGDIGLDRSTYDLGLAGGGGLEIKLLDTLGMSFGLLYTYGLLDLDKSDGDSMKQRALTLRAGLVYSIG